MNTTPLLRISLFILSCQFLFSCVNYPDQPAAFRLPKVILINEPDSLRLFDASCIMEQSAFISGVSGFTDTLDFIQYRPNGLGLPFKDYRGRSKWDSLPGSGLEVYADYQKNVPLTWTDSKENCYYPVYLVNSSTETKFLFGYDSYVYAIQEAIDSSGTWYPIEMSGIYWGCSRWCTPLVPKTFALLLLPKYKGSFKTKLRLRLRSGNQTLVSQPFDGVIDYRQFSMHPNAYFMLKKQSFLDLSNEFFYGALPSEATSDKAFEEKIRDAKN